MDAYTWKEEEIDCGVFQNGLPASGSSLDMGFVDKLRLGVGEDKEFLPCGNIFVRQEVKDVFAVLTDPEREFCQILIGSPGVGKSVLLFLVALFQASVMKKPSLYIRKTNVPNEDISAFLIKPQPERYRVDVTFARDIDLRWKVWEVERHLVTSYTATKWNGHKRLKKSQDTLLFLDGLDPGDDELQNYNFHNYLSTSAGHDSPSGEQEAHMSLVILSAWEKEILRLAIVDSLRLLPNDDTDDRFEVVYYHTGGRIREAIAFIRDKEKWVRDNAKMITGIDISDAKLAVTDTKSNASQKSLDMLRTMYTSKEHPGAHQIVDSQFYARELSMRLGPESYFNAYAFAKEKNLMAAAGCHFEELLHEFFKDLKPSPVEEVIQGKGSGAEGAQQLNKTLAYWIPSTPNFANIDAAFVDKQMKLWCIQYTVSSKRTFNRATFRAKFLRPMRKQVQFKDDDSEIEILFVVPVGVKFTIPEEAGQFSCQVVSIDCSSMTTAKGLPFPFLTHANAS